MGKVSMPQGNGSQLHNRRDYEKIGKPIPDNIDSSKTVENIVLVDKNIKEAYREIFGEALEKYNNKQKRADRKISDYCEHIKKSRNGEKLFYEDVVQWGSRDDFQSLEIREKAKEALVKYADSFEERNPNLKLIGAYIHMDEASPHLHIDYVPVAVGYSRGLEVRNSLDKAMKQMGYIPENESRKNNATKLWKENERAYFGKICRDMGLEVEVESKSERKNLTVDEYKYARDEMIGELEQEKEAIIAEVEPLRKLKIDIDEIKNAGMRLPFGYLAVRKKDFDEVKKQAKAYIANRDEIRGLRKRSTAVFRREQLVEEREQQLDDKANKLMKLEQELQQIYQRQFNLNQVLEESERSGRSKDKVIEDLKADNALLKGQIKQVNDELWSEINAFTGKLKEACLSLVDIVKAVRMLKYDKENGYEVKGLTKQQERLIDGIAEYGAKWAKDNGFLEMADEMRMDIDTSKSVKKIIELSTPKRSKGRDIER